MKYLKQFGIILMVSLLGEFLRYLIPLTIPASIYGIVIMFLLLLFKIIPLEEVADVAHFLVNIMPVMFIPAAVELMDMWGIIGGNLVKYILLIVVSTAIVMGVSGLVSQFVIRRSKKDDK